MTKSKTDVTILDEAAIADLEATPELATPQNISALCQTVRQLLEENQQLIRERDAAKGLIGADVRGQIEGVFGDQEHVKTRFRLRAIQICRDRASEWGWLGLSNTWFAGKEEAANELAGEIEQLK